MTKSTKTKASSPSVVELALAWHNDLATFRRHQTRRDPDNVAKEVKWIKKYTLLHAKTIESGTALFNAVAKYKKQKVA